MIFHSRQRQEFHVVGLWHSKVHFGCFFRPLWFREFRRRLLDLAEHGRLLCDEVTASLFPLEDLSQSCQSQMDSTNAPKAQTGVTSVEPAGDGTRGGVGRRGHEGDDDRKEKMIVFATDGAAAKDSVSNRQCHGLSAKLCLGTKELDHLSRRELDKERIVVVRHRCWIAKGQMRVHHEGDAQHSKRIVVAHGMVVLEG